MRTPVSLPAHTAPLVCAVHCLAAPLFASGAPLLASAPAEWGFFAAGAALPLAASLEAYRHHRRPAPVLAVAAAIAAWALSLGGAWWALPEEATTAAACAALAAASVWSARVRHRAACDGCGCPAGHPGRAA